MGSSPGFGSTPGDYRFALFGLAFAAAPGVTPLAWPPKVTRWVILQEARRHTLARTRSHLRRNGKECETVLRLLVGIRFQVLFHSPGRGAFHLSLAVLVHYRSPKVFSLGAWTPRIRTGLACPVLLRYSTRRSQL